MTFVGTIVRVHLPKDEDKKNKEGEKDGDVIHGS